MKTLLAAAIAFSATTALTQSPAAIDYRFEQVKRSVVLTTPKQEINVAAGQHAQSGDRVSTGWFSYALIASEQYRAKFEIFSSTDVRLAEGTPGVLLAVDRGKIRAMFDKIVGSEPRVVKTPGAMLAVRGTKFDVEVDNVGRTTLDVFEGVVEVQSDLLHEPLMVHPGEQSVFGRHDPPTTHPMPDDHRRNDPTHQLPQGGGDSHGMGPHGSDPHQPGQQPPSRPSTPPPGGHH